MGAGRGVGCERRLGALGVYVPGRLGSGVVAVVVASALGGWLGRRPGTRLLAQSGLFFCSLTVMLALLVWWFCFSGF